MPPKDAAKDASAGPIQLENTAKRDFLQKLEKESQDFWAQQHVFDINAPTQDDGLVDMTPEEVRAKYPKWFATIPYAYMNGSLHLGHAFTLSKVEFAAGYERMQGKRALFPWAFHCTGMPIRAAADKLVREIELFGEDFSGYKDPADEAEEQAAPEPPAPTENTSSVTKTNVAKATKGKLAGKDTGLKYQFQIMLNSGVPKDEIKKFADANYWLSYFPPIAKADCTAFGSRIDWRRAFITTDVNPYYDSFVRWQMNKLHAMNKIKFGERYTIYSPKDGQPCMDHDRSDGEGLGPQEYTGLKMELVQWGALAAPELDAKLQGKNVYFVAATLRPETMYGQTNCYVGPTIDYGAFQINDTDVFICTERAARNMAYQGITKERGEVKSLATVKGSQLIGTKIKAPFGLYPEVYVLPMETVLATKGTGVVTSVPSDSPDDYATLMDLRKKAEYFKIDPQWAAFEPIPVIRTPAYGDMTAETLVKQLKIQSAKDKNHWLRPRISPTRRASTTANLAFAYAEPRARSSAEVPTSVSLLSATNGTWTTYLVESLSDSTIYMSYYTIAHHLQGGVADGSKVGPIGIKAEELTDEIWDYILGDSAFPADSTIPKEKAEVLRREFRYFYPMDLRSSGKDLIPNHLTFCVYVHSAIFPEHHWPKAIRANGHLMLNGKKMSKSTGNSLSLRQSVEKFGADATRLPSPTPVTVSRMPTSRRRLPTPTFSVSHSHRLVCRGRCQQGQAPLRPKDSFWDKSFENQINNLTQLTNDATPSALQGCHQTQALLITPIAPHFAEHVWRNFLGEKTSIQTARWPEASAPVDNSITEALAYVSGTVKTVRDAEILLTKKAKGKNARLPLASSTTSVPPRSHPRAAAKDGMLKDKKVMNFIVTFKKRIADFGAQTAFNRLLPFNEIETLKLPRDTLRRA
ncbi:probable CDC60 - leucine--tRNA ligase, cytosolic [Ustilago trichophora]|uniref:leucine--tRNA ligase n=1 Tax=Ustilago trichophora TaxID=86804 RepID=A0A5C3E630_9BASI|nr:probable CDC60 - leucine--tRNA ligase, cytosolic [Ustilago trichophora]